MAQTKIRQGQQVVDSIAVPYAKDVVSNNTGNYSTTSTSQTYIDQTNLNATMTVKYGKLVRVDLQVEGLWSSNIGYNPYFDIGVDGTTTKSTTGEQSTSAAGWGGNNWTTDGASRGAFNGVFFFENLSTGSHTFYPLWRSTNASYTMYIGQYAQIRIFVSELYMQ